MKKIKATVSKVDPKIRNKSKVLAPVPSFSAYAMSTPCQPSKAVALKFKHKLFSSVRGSDVKLTVEPHSGLGQGLVCAPNEGTFFVNKFANPLQADLRHWLATAISMLAIERSHFSPLLPLIADAGKLHVGHTPTPPETYYKDLDKIVADQPVTLFPAAWHNAGLDECYDLVNNELGSSALQSRLAQLFFYALDSKCKNWLNKDRTEDRLYRCQVSYINLMLNLVHDNLVSGLEAQTKEAAESLREICLASFVIRYWDHHPNNVNALVRLSVAIVRKALGHHNHELGYFAIHPDLKHITITKQSDFKVDCKPRSPLKFVGGDSISPDTFKVMHLNTTPLTDLFII